VWIKNPHRTITGQHAKPDGAFWVGGFRDKLGNAILVTTSKFLIEFRYNKTRPYGHDRFTAHG
jgi:hypothetical protein